MSYYFWTKKPVKSPNPVPKKRGRFEAEREENLGEDNEDEDEDEAEVMQTEHVGPTSAPKSLDLFSCFMSSLDKISGVVNEGKGKLNKEE